MDELYEVTPRWWRRQRRTTVAAALMRHGVGGEDPEGEGGGEGASLTLSAAFLWCVAARQRSLGNPTKTDDQTTSHSWS